MDKTYTGVNEALNNWKCSFISKASLYCAISRKAPRLLECLTANEDDISIVTELAIPYVIDEKVDSVNLSDDAIYFGSTFERIYGNLLTAACLNNAPLKNNQIKSFPVIASKSVRRLEEVLNIQLSTQYVDDAYIPFYIDTIISKFFTLGKPYDIEFPIITFHVNTDDLDLIESAVRTYKTLLNDKFDIDSKTYKIDNYCRENGKHYYNFTLLIKSLPDVSDNSIQSEFQKLRFFVNNKKINLASYAPSIIPDEYLTKDSPLFVNTVYHELWNLVYNRSYGFNDCKMELSNDFLVRERGSETLNEQQKEIQLYEYAELKKQSLIVFANYLLSFDRYLRIIMLFDIAFQDLIDSPLRIQKKDLAYLIGPYLAEIVTDRLNWLLIMRAHSGYNKIETDNNNIAEFIPESFIEKYNLFLHSDLKHSYSVSQCVSSVFSNMHRLIEIESRKKNIIQYDRLRFGDSFSGLYQLLLEYYSAEVDKLGLYMHSAIDKRIDGGSVVPNYIRLKKGDRHLWGRYFRPGENDDRYKDQLFRLILYVVDKFTQERGVSEMPMWIFNASLVLIAGNIPESFCLNKICSIDFKCKYNEENDDYAVSYIDENGFETLLLDYAIKSSILEWTDDNNFVSVADNDYTDYLRTGLQFSSEVEKEIDNRIKIMNVFMDYFLKDDICEIFNYYFCPKVEKLNSMLHEWVRMLFEKLDEEKYQSSSLEKMENELFAIYSIIPSDNNYFVDYLDLGRISCEKDIKNCISSIVDYISNFPVERMKAYELFSKKMNWYIDVYSLLLYRYDRCEQSALDDNLQELHMLLHDETVVSTKKAGTISPIMSDNDFRDYIKDSSNEVFFKILKILYEVN